MQNMEPFEPQVELSVVPNAALAAAASNAAPTRMMRSRDTSPASLQHRLEEGWDLIEAAHARGEDIRTLEDHWIRLLHQYERVCEQDAA